MVALMLEHNGREPGYAQGSHEFAMTGSGFKVGNGVWPTRYNTYRARGKAAFFG
jgi:hypothetical protein